MGQEERPCAWLAGGRAERQLGCRDPILQTERIVGLKLGGDWVGQAEGRRVLIRVSG